MMAHRPPPLETAGPEELRADIAAARADLGQTLQALAGRADVPTRARASVVHARQRLRRSWRSPAPWLILSAGMSAAAVVLVLLRGRRR